MQLPSILNWVTCSLLIAMVCAFIVILLLYLIRRYCFKRRVEQAAMQDPFSGAPRGVDPSVIESFPSFTAAEGKKVCGGMNVCVICLAVFKEDETLRSMPTCGHVFHSGCVDSWLKTHSTCPCCRASLIPGPDGPVLFFSKLFRPAS
ncbi:hypothetical protein SOVF_138100 [Spinacia oleracea]|nr:hypothetical protein SOVF_138100 [Spinacia oleracea]